MPLVSHVLATFGRQFSGGSRNSSLFFCSAKAIVGSVHYGSVSVIVENVPTIINVCTVIVLVCTVLRPSVNLKFGGFSLSFDVCFRCVCYVETTFYLYCNSNTYFDCDFCFEI